MMGNQTAGPKVKVAVDHFWEMNGVKFNVLLGLFSAIVLPYIAVNVDLDHPNVFIGIIALLIYFGEAWAFHYKTTLMRLRAMKVLRTVQGERASLPGVGCMIVYAFLMRLCFRIVLLTISLSAFGLMPMGDGEPSVFAIIIIIIGVLGELVLLGMAWMETRLVDSDDEQDRMQADRKWYAKYEIKLSDENIRLKESGADLVLFIVALMYTHTFWNMSNHDFMESINHSFYRDEPGWVVFLLIFLANFALCLFLLVPVRLAYWIGESLMVIERKQKWRLILSLFFAGLCTTGPVFAHFVKVYLL